MTSAPRTFFIENLGCPKNAVEGEGMAERLAGAGYLPAASAEAADVVVVNTCSFIRPAQEESIERIFHYLGRRRSGQRVIAAGCLAERFGDALEQEIPELDGILGTRRWYEIAQLMQQVERGLRPCWHGAEPAEDPTFTRRGPQGPAPLVAGPTAYVKIAEGCNMRCTFCAIPSFKGPQRSKPPEDVVREVRELVDAGVREVILVSQNTTAYGQDLARRPSHRGTALARLLERICAAVPDLPWLRFHYCYPGWVDDDLLRTMARLDQVVKYLDVPLQHAHPAILRAMRRPSNVDQVRSILARARDLMPQVALRTTFIVGFPGETDAHFDSLLRFMDDVRFDHVGIFPYFQEDGTPAAGLPDQVPDRVKQRRKRQALALQQRLSLDRNRLFVGRELQVLVEGTADESIAGRARPGGAPHARTTPAQLIGRTFRDAPEVDGFVVFRGLAGRGELVPVRITAAGPYDLFGEQAGVDLPAPPPAAHGAPPRGRAGAGRSGLRSLPVLQPR